METKAFKVPDCKSKDFDDAFNQSLIKIEHHIIAEIVELSGNDSSEIARIKNAYHWCIRNNNPGEDKEPTYRESCLSFALMALEDSAACYANGDLPEAFNHLTDASIYLGWSQGSDEAENKNILSKKAIQQLAESKRHAKDRLNKEQAMKYYKDNHAADIDKIEGQKGKAKDEAAHAMQGKFNIGWRTARSYIDEFHKKNTPS